MKVPALVVVFHPRASGDVERALGWYSERAPDVALRFVTACELCLTRLVALSHKAPVVESPVKIANLRRA